MGPYHPKSKMRINLNVNKKYLKVAGIIIVAIAVLIGIGYMIIQSIYNGMVIKEDKKGLKNIPKYNRNESEEEGDINQNIAIFGVDKDEMRTDVIFVVNLNTQTDEIKVIAVPRDTKVAWTQFQQDKMEELGKGYHEYSKITEMSAYGGIDNLRYFTVNTLEDIMGLRIDHYAVINIDAFRKIVDAIGGVEVDVPRRMEYNDSYQDLHINLQPGLQLLNGEQAEGLVRWRHNEDYSEQYAEGDVGRIETQQIFLKALAEKLLSTDTAGQLLKVLNAVYSDLKTDIKFNELQTYIDYANQFKLSNITFATLPGEAVREDKWYYILNQAEVDAFMQKILYNRDVPIIEEESEVGEEVRATTKQETYYQPDETKEVERIPEVEVEDTDESAIELPTSTPESPKPSVVPKQVVEESKEGKVETDPQNSPEGTSAPEIIVTPTPPETISAEEIMPSVDASAENNMPSNEQSQDNLGEKVEEQSGTEGIGQGEVSIESGVVEEVPIY